MENDTSVGQRLKKAADVYEENKAVCSLAATAMAATVFSDPAPVVVVVESGAAALASDSVAIGEAVAEAAGESVEGLAELATLAAEAGVVSVMATAAGIALPVILGTAGLVGFGYMGYAAWKSKGQRLGEAGDRIKADWNAGKLEAREIPNVDWDALAQECNGK